MAIALDERPSANRDPAVTAGSDDKPAAHTLTSRTTDPVRATEEKVTRLGPGALTSPVTYKEPGAVVKVPVVSTRPRPTVTQSWASADAEAAAKSAASSKFLGIPVWGWLVGSVGVYLLTRKK